jgi:hypothetical protein
MAEQKDRLAGAASWADAEFEYVAEVLLAVKLDAAAQFGSEGGNEAHSRIDGELVVAGRFDEDEVSQVGCKPGRLRVDGCEELGSIAHGM